MNQQEKMKKAKDSALELFAPALEDCVQCGDYTWAILQEVDGTEVWVTFNVTAKKNFDIDDTIDDWNEKKRQDELKKKLRAEKAALKKKKKK